MAIRCSCTKIFIPRCQVKKASARASLLHNSQMPNKASLITLSKSCNNIKVFEDQVTGIVCHRDGNGEIVCEGYDEGPRFHRENLAQKISQTRRSELEIPDLLQLMKLQAVEDTYLYLLIQEHK